MSNSSLVSQLPTTPRDPQPRGLPAWVYAHPELTRIEIERILRPSWQIACHLSQIPNPGCYVTFELGTDSVIVLRDAAGTIRALRNVCRHRGTRLLEGAGTCRGRITCPYHGWTYRYDGSLLALPARESFPDLDLSEHSLNAVRHEVTMGFVFVCLAGDPPPPSQVWAPIIDELAPYHFEDLVPTQPLYYDEWNVDWKIAMDNYLESYHVPIGHPGLSRLFTPDYEDQRGVPGIARGFSWMREAPSPRWSERIYQKYVGAVTEPYLPEANRRSWRFYSCLPNLGIDIQPEQVNFFQVLPRGPGKTVVRGASIRSQGRSARDAAGSLARQPDQYAGQQGRQIPLRTAAAGTGGQRLSAGATIPHRELDARVPRSVALPNSGIPAAGGTGQLRLGW